MRVLACASYICDFPVIAVNMIFRSDQRTVTAGIGGFHADAVVTQMGPDIRSVQLKRVMVVDQQGIPLAFFLMAYQMRSDSPVFMINKVEHIR